MPYVAESLVIDDHGKLVALIVPDTDAATAKGLSTADVDKIMVQNIKDVNKDLESYSKLSSHRLMDKEFEKTPKRSIKRFLYQV